MPRTIKTVWEVSTYDVWGNAREGYDVNDRYIVARALPLELTVETANPNTPHAFEHATPSDKQIREVFGLGNAAKIETDGDDLAIYVERARDGYPIGQLICQSHESLSPIRERKGGA